MSHVEVKCPNISGMGTVIKIDGVEQELVTRAEIKIDMAEPASITIHKWMSGLKLEGEFQVDEIFTFPDQPDKKYRLVEVSDETGELVSEETKALIKQFKDMSGKKSAIVKGDP